MNTGEVIALIKAFGGGGGGSSGGGVLVVHETVSGTTHTLDKTWQEIHDALAQGIPCVTVYTNRNNVEQGQIVFVSGIPGNYYVSVLSAQATTPVVVKLTATSADGYPARSDE